MTFGNYNPEIIGIGCLGGVCGCASWLAGGLGNTNIGGEFEKLPGDSFINILSDEVADGYAHGQITESFLKAHVNIPATYIYICGPPPMMNAIEKQLANLKIDEKQIIKEVF